MKRYEWIENLDISKEQKDLLAAEIDEVKRLPDGDLGYAMEYHPCGFSVNEIENVLATIPGHNDEDSWHWVVVLSDKRFFYMTGWCDYTGWDCQSGLTVEEGKDPFDCATKSKEWGAQLRNQLLGLQPWGVSIEENRGTDNPL